MPSEIPQYEGDTLYSRAHSATGVSLAEYVLLHRLHDESEVLAKFREVAEEGIPLPTPDEEKWAHLYELSKSILPVIIEGEVPRFRTTQCHPFLSSYIWYESLGEEARVTPLIQFRTLHRYGYYGFFKPSVAETLAQIPPTYLDRTGFFSLAGPQTASDLSREPLALHAGFHVATCTLYSRNPS